MNTEFNPTNIIAQLDTVAENNKIAFTSDLMDAVEIFASHTHIVSGVGSPKSPLTTTRIISINSSARKLINSDKAIALKAIELLKIDDIIEIDDFVKNLKSA